MGGCLYWGCGGKRMFKMSLGVLFVGCCLFYLLFILCFLLLMMSSVLKSIEKLMH